MNVQELGVLIGIAKSIPGTAAQRAESAQGAAESAQTAAEAAADVAMNYGHSVRVANGMLIIENAEEEQEG